MSRRVALTRTAKRQLCEDLPEHVAAAAWELIQGDLSDKPQNVGKPLMEPYTGDWSARRGTYRIRYRFADKIVTILSIKPRSTAYQASPTWVVPTRHPEALSAALQAAGEPAR